MNIEFTICPQHMIYTMGTPNDDDLDDVVIFMLTWLSGTRRMRLVWICVFVDIYVVCWVNMWLINACMRACWTLFEKAPTHYTLHYSVMCAMFWLPFVILMEGDQILEAAMCASLYCPKFGLSGSCYLIVIYHRSGIKDDSSNEIFLIIFDVFNILFRLF